ncbi:DUF805 domain-containing protein [Pelomonas sp. HMWF004]|nr:DUF805 domain-containing protein [Pelomonas sp. HMWF004]
MNFQDAIRTCFSKYADFSGRASRPEYWWFFLFLMLVYIAASLISDVAYWVTALVTLLPSLAAGARRLHDTGRSAWWLLIGLVPVIGGIVLLVLLAQETKEDALVV